MGLHIYRDTENVLQAQCPQSSGFPLHSAANLSSPIGKPAHPSPGLPALPLWACRHRKGKHFYRLRGSSCPVLLGLPNPSSSASHSVQLSPCLPGQSTSCSQPQPQPGASWQGAVCVYIHLHIYIYIKIFPCPWRGAFAAAVHIDQVGLPGLPTFSKSAYKSTSICSLKRSIYDLNICLKYIYIYEERTVNLQQ